MVNTQDFVGMFFRLPPQLCNGLCNRIATPVYAMDYAIVNIQNFVGMFFFELRINQLFSFFRKKCYVSFCWPALDIGNLAGDCVVCSCQCQVPYVNVPENVW